MMMINNTMMGPRAENFFLFFSQSCETKQFGCSFDKIFINVDMLFSGLMFVWPLHNKNSIVLQ